jgi:hypothetical protein
MKSSTTLDERGYFQIHPDEAKDLGLDHQRLSTDREYSIKSGIQLVNHYEKFARSLEFSGNDELFWRVVKFIHATGPGAAKKLFADMRSRGTAPSDWAAIREYANTNRERLLPLMKHDPVKWIDNVDKLFAEARRLTRTR